MAQRKLVDGLFRLYDVSQVRKSVTISSYCSGSSSSRRLVFSGAFISRGNRPSARAIPGYGSRQASHGRGPAGRTRGVIRGGSSTIHPPQPATSLNGKAGQKTGGPRAARSGSSPLASIRLPQTRPSNSGDSNDRFQIVDLLGQFFQNGQARRVRAVERRISANLSRCEMNLHIPGRTGASQTFLHHLRE